MNKVNIFFIFTGFLLVTLSLAAFAAANPSSGVYLQYLTRGGIQCRSNCRNVQNPHQNCPPVDCGPVVRDGMCGEPDCSLPGNRLRLHPTNDPNWFWQCAPLDAWGRVGPIRRPCGNF